MTPEKKTAPKRGISNARLLKATNGIVKGYDLKDSDTIGALTEAIEADIIKDALDKA
jgi:hypothetical protein